MTICSHLFRLTPSKDGTPDVESITSYISRLASEHCVPSGYLIDHEFSRHLHKHYLNVIAKRGGSGFYANSQMLNGLGQAAHEFVTVLEALTMRDDLSLTTLLGWEGVFPSRGLLHSKRYWCPICFEERKLKDQIIYEPLLWTLSASKVCIHHTIYLKSRCPHCGRENWMLERNSKPGYCTKCGHWLGHLAKEPEFISRELIGEAKYLYWLLTKRNHITSLAIREILNQCIEISGKSISDLGSELEIPKTTFWGWIHGKNLIPLDRFLKVLSFCDPLSFTCDGKVINLRKQRLESKVISVPKTGCDDIFKLEERSPPSATKVANSIGISRKTLLNRNPKVYRQIVKKRQHYLTQQKIKRYEKLSKEVRFAAQELTKQGIYPSRRVIERYLNRPALLHERALQMVWKDELRILWFPIINQG